MDLNDNDVNTFAKQFQRNDKVFWRGRWIDTLEIAELLVYQTEECSNNYETPEVTGSSAIFSQHKGMDVTRQFITGPPSVRPLKEEKIPKVPSTGQHVFIVHGRDMAAAHELARLLESLDLEPVILAEQPGGAATIIEKLEKYSNVGFAFVILTPDDIGSLASANPDLKHRARQNVVLEMGYFMGLLGRERVYCLYKGDIELPSDMVGVSYAQFNNSIKEVYWYIIKELKAAGFRI